MNIQIFGKPKCFDTKKAERFFKDRGIKYQFVNLSEYGINKRELESVINGVGSIDLILDEKSKDLDSALIKYLAKYEDKIEKIYINLKNKTKEIFFKSKNYIEEKLTPDSQKKGSLSNKAVSIILFLLSLALIIPAFGIVLFMVSVAAVLIMSLIIFVTAIPLMVSFAWPSPEIVCFFIFMSMAFIGFQILSWQIFVFVVRLMRKVYRRYINWIKTRKIYVDADIRKEVINSNKNKGGKEHE